MVMHLCHTPCRQTSTVFPRYLALVATAHTPTAATAPIILCLERTMDCHTRQGPADAIQHHVGSALDTLWHTMLQLVKILMQSVHMLLA